MNERVVYGMVKKSFVGVLLGVVVGLAGSAQGAAIQITEWMYKGTNGEFVEFTNTGSTPVDMTGWSYSDSDNAPGDLDFGTVFGTVRPGESVILTETAVGTFRTAWGLVGSSVKIFGSNNNSNLGRADQIHLYDASKVEVDSLIFDDQTSKGPRTENKSCNIPAAGYNVTTASSAWALASVGDGYGSRKSSGNDTGSPGQVPEPLTLGLLALGGLVIGRKRTL